MRYQLDEDKGDLLYEVENDNLIHYCPKKFSQT